MKCYIAQVVLISTVITGSTLFMFTLNGKSKSLEYTRVPAESFTTITLPDHWEDVEKAQNRTWISMAVCWSGNTDLHGKGNFPYKLAANLSSTLWHMKTSHEVIIQVIYDDHYKGKPELLEYVEQLRANKNFVIQVPAKNMDCALKAQLQRLLPHSLPIVSTEDIVVTSDVDAFVIDDNIFSNLNQSYKVWVYRYKQVVDYASLHDNTVPVCFVAMKSKLWQEQTRNAVTAEHLVLNFDMLNLTRKTGPSTWSIDQLILSYFLLDSQLCSIPNNHLLWKDLSLIPPKKQFNDTGICFHGMTYENCFVGRPNLPYGCRWWHFTPSTTEDYLRKKFEEIATGRLTS